MFDMSAIMGYNRILSFLLMLGPTFFRPTLAQGDSQTTDMTQSGNYRILKCNAGQQGSLASDLVTLLPRIWNNLQAVITDANHGTASQYGFETFFHGNNNIAYVKEIFQFMADGSPVPLPTEGRATNPLLNLGYPTIVCIQPGDPQTALPYATCEAELDMIAATSANNFIALCPAFWEYPTEATIDKCPRVRRNTLTPNTDALKLNQEGIIVEELAHIYGVVPAQSWQEGILETYRIRDAADLDEQSALENGPNFAFYYSAIRAGCTRWPDRALPHDNLRGLLEVPNSNTTEPVIIDESIPPLPSAITDICDVAVYAPNTSVCCNTTSGLWIPSAEEGQEVDDGGSVKAAC